ncbi:carbohydrate porin [Acetobacteraceae bacterium KSS8]|uniref:Carbohydrate porin n=1 Tax=Endosaccharibacter trunci TaxID=2812733 RepID=A0ABT1W5E7_9PROT|nr:carbohydrate porin [Acetobacteraceae bacterium KSS8]
MRVSSRMASSAPSRSLPATVCLAAGLLAAALAGPARAQAINGGLSISPSLNLATPLQANLPFFPDTVLPTVHPLYGDPFGLRNGLRDRGVDILADMRNELGGNLTGGTQRTSAMVNQIGLEADIDWNRLAHIPGFSTSMVVVNRTGASVSGGYGDAFVRSQDILRSSSGGAVAHLVYAYAEEKIAHGRLALQLGREPVALDFAASPLNCAFMSNAICGNPKALTGRDPGFSVYPNSTWAGRLIAYPLRNLYVQAGLFAFDTGADAGATFDHTGWQFDSARIKGTTSVGEVGYIPSLGQSGLIGHYKVGIAHEHGPLSEIGTDVNGGPLGVTGRPARNASNRNKEWVLFDQMLVRHGAGIDNGLIVVGGYVHNQPDVNSYGDERYLGLVDRGFWRSRPADTLGLLYATVSASEVLTETQRLQAARGKRLSNGATGVQTAETIFEAFYDMRVCTGLSVAPDVQYIINPNAERRIPNAVVLGVRTRVSF